MHQEPFIGRAGAGIAGDLTTLPQTPQLDWGPRKGEQEEERWEEMEGMKGREGERMEMKGIEE